MINMYPIINTDSNFKYARNNYVLKKKKKMFSYSNFMNVFVISCKYLSTN